MSSVDTARFARLALACVEREFPYQAPILLRSEQDLRLPRDETPAFRGCFDWHSAVHSHWLLVRLLATGGAGAVTEEARAVLARSLTPEHLAAEERHLQRRPAFERPYGLAWLLALETELHAWDDPAAPPLAAAVAPLAEVARSHLASWLPRLTHPVRSGAHSQTAFALALALDHARADGHTGFEERVIERATALFGDDHDYAPHLEPSGEDFLSPTLGAADLMRRVLGAEAFAAWLTRVLPSLPDGLPSPERVSDPTDGRLAHLDGLNLSRAWMLRGIASALPGGDPRREPLRECAAHHTAAGLAAVTEDRYETAHWLGSFAVYLLTG
jgi:hypothetical protein